jgi:hypothetical protein
MRFRRRRPRLRRPIVLTVDPALVPGMTVRAMRGWASRTGLVRAVRYGPLPWPIPLPIFATFTTKNLDDALRSALRDTDNMVWCVGWSQGGQITYKWLRDYGPTSDIPPDRVRFVSLGNPERLHGGACVVPNPPTKISGRPKASYGGCGVPEGNRYTVWDFVRQHDGWADCPTVEQPTAEAWAACDDGIHMDYFTVSIEDSDVVAFTGPDNVTYFLKPTVLPDRAKQARIEQSYRRPPYAGVRR